MHKMENTPRIVTIIGLVMEGISVFVLAFSTILIFRITSLPGLGSAQEAEMTIDQYNELILIMDWIGYIVLGMTIVILIFFTINMFLFIRLMMGKYTDEQAKKIYLYQAIWGGVNLITNQITGILYLVSGVQGYNGEKDSIDIRDGI